MHLIEQLFGISPDGGTGLTELVILLGPAVVWLIVRRRRRGWHRASRS
jgi:hypothetical protein